MTSLKRIIFHWTAGPYGKTALDHEHYHFTIGANGDVEKGRFEPEDNIPPLVSGQYAAHCGGGNSSTIGVAFRGMAGYINPSKVGKFPLTKKQCEAGYKLAAELCIHYGIEVSPETVLTHYEFGCNNPKTSSRGKIDITHLPYEPKRPASTIGQHIRGKVNWYQIQLMKDRIV